MRPLGKLTDIQCRTANPGTYGDGGGLLLQVKSRAGRLSKSWIFRYSVAGSDHWVGLGAYPDVTLARAREKAQDARRLRTDGHDPLAQKRAVRVSLSREQAKQTIPTFDQCRDAYVASHQAGWRSVRHSHDWVQSLKAHVTPMFGSVPVDMIDTALVCKALEPLWRGRVETASRVRGRIEAVLNWARVRGYRTGENPARWNGHLSNLLPARSKVAATKHHAALPYDQVPAFITELQQHGGATARALEFLILTAARSNEALGASWSELDLAGRMWTIPGNRMKSHKEHRVPLSTAAIALLEKLPRNGVHVFPGTSQSRLSPTVLIALLRRMGHTCTAHGFRSAFRDWAAERTNYPSEVAELALAHTVGNKVEAAYRRTDMFDRRRRLMGDWANFCDGKSTMGAEVIPIRA
jgi:integrase